MPRILKNLYIIILSQFYLIVKVFVLCSELFGIFVLKGEREKRLSNFRLDKYFFFDIIYIRRKPKIQKRGSIMNFLNVDFARGTTALFKEAFKFKKYKAMPAGFAVVVGIFQIPFVLLSFLFAGFVYILNFVKKLAAIPTEQIHGVVRNEKDEVKAGAQTVIYLISWPFIFLCYVSLILATYMLNILYILVALTAFVWSLGGFRFHMLLSDAECIEKDVEGKYNKKALIAFVVCIIAILVLLPILLTAFYYIGLPAPDKTYLFKTAGFKMLMENMLNVFKSKIITAIPMLFGFSFVYTLIAFVPFPKANKAAPAIAMAVADAVAAEEETAVEEACEETAEEVAEEAPAEAEAESEVEVEAE